MVVEASALLVPTRLAAGLEKIFGCALGDAERPQFVASGYRGGVTESVDVYGETPFLRVFVFDHGASSVDEIEPLTVASALADGDPGREFATAVNGLAATGFWRSTAEPVLHPWPAMVWEQDSLVISILGEGLTRTDVEAAARSLQPVTRQEFESEGASANC